MDLWLVFETHAIKALKQGVEAEPLNRRTLEEGLHLLAIAKAKDPNAPAPPLTIFTDQELADIVKSLV
jgi:hypothetical protein